MLLYHNVGMFNVETCIRQYGPAQRSLSALAVLLYTSGCKQTDVLYAARKNDFVLSDPLRLSRNRSHSLRKRNQLQ